MFGYGLAGRAFHAPLIAAVAGLELAAIVTRDEGRRGHARAEHPAARLLAGPGEVWAARDELDLVVVATPNVTHVPLATAALEAGLPVVVDKPLAATAAQARELAALARDRGPALVPFQNRRWDGDFLTVRELLREGALGEAWRFESRFERWRPAPKGGWRELADPEQAGGVLLDLGSHLVDQALTLFGPVRAVGAELDVRRPGAVVVDDAFVALEHVGGVRSHLWMSQADALPGPRFRVLGSRAAYVKHGLDVQEDQLRGGRGPGDPGFGEEPQEHWGVVGDAEQGTRPVPTEPGRYVAFYEAVAAMLHEGAPPPVTPAEAVAALEVLEAAQAAARERRVVAL